MVTSKHCIFNIICIYRKFKVEKKRVEIHKSRSHAYHVPKTNGLQILSLIYSLFGVIRIRMSNDLD